MVSVDSRAELGTGQLLAESEVFLIQELLKRIAPWALYIPGVFSFLVISNPHTSQTIDLAVTDPTPQHPIQQNN
jgi:hypothetical protein